MPPRSGYQCSREEGPRAAAVSVARSFLNNLEGSRQLDLPIYLSVIVFVVQAGHGHGSMARV